MAGQKRKASNTGDEARIVKKGADWRPRTRNEKTQASSAKVLGTAELFEAVLSYLPMKDIFASKRVCKQWNDFIKDSPVLQKKMFLRASAAPIRPDIPLSNHHPRRGPTYSTGFSLHPATDISRIRSLTGHPSVIKTSKSGFGVWGIADGFQPDEIRIYFDLGTVDQRDILMPPSRTTGSWRGTSITQPPVQDLGVEIFGSANIPSPQNNFFTLHKDHGVTWGDIAAIHEGDLVEVGVPAGGVQTMMMWLSIKKSALSSAAQFTIEHCKGHKDWDGKCGCLWVLSEELQH